MADIVTLGDVSTKYTGSGSKLKTGGRRKYNMADKCKTGEVYSSKLKKCVSNPLKKMMKTPIHGPIKGIHPSKADSVKLKKDANIRKAIQSTKKYRKKT